MLQNQALHNRAFLGWLALFPGGSLVAITSRKEKGMKTYRVGICDADLDYATALMDYINAAPEKRLRVIAFSGINAVKDYLSVQDLDLLLTDDITDCDEGDEGLSLQSVRVIPLSEYRDCADGWRDESSQEAYIYKYQNAQMIIRSLSSFLTQRSQNRRQISRTIAVYSPLGRCGKTRLAGTIAANDEVRGGLYVSMETFGERPDLLDSNIFYLIKSESPELEEVISRQIELDNGIYRLYLSSSFLDTRDVSFEDMEMLIKCLLKSGRFTSLVFDIGSAAIADMRILSLFDQIYMPVLSDDVSIRKVEVFTKLIKAMGVRNILTRLVKLELPDAEENSSEMVAALWKARNDGGLD